MALSDLYFHQFRVRPNEDESTANAEYFAQWLIDHGWSLEAASGALGNWEVETYLNPNFPSSSLFPSYQGGGFGMPHWTPWYNKFGVWALGRYGLTATATDDNPLADFELQMEFHEYDCLYGYQGGKTWYNNHGYSYTWQSFKRSRDAPETLAAAYYWQYERSAAQSEGDRPERARKWYDWLNGRIKRKFPYWILFKIREANFH